jgi:hypothetical protein
MPKKPQGEGGTGQPFLAGCRLVGAKPFELGSGTGPIGRDASEAGDERLQESETLRRSEPRPLGLVGVEDAVGSLTVRDRRLGQRLPRCTNA